MKFSRDPEPETVETTPRRRWRFWLMVFGIPLVLGALALIGWIVSAHTGLTAAIAEADRLDPGWRLNDIEAKRISPADAENAAVVIARIKQTPPNGAPDYKVEEVLQGLQPPRLLNDQQQDAVKKLLEWHAPRVPIAQSLRTVPHGRHAVTWAPDGVSTLLKCQENREAATALRYDVLARCQAGDMDGAIAGCIACFHAGASIGDEPTTISMLVRIACQMVAVSLTERTLAQGEPSPAILAELQQRIEAQEPAPLLLIAARGERAMSTQFFESLRSGQIGANAVTGIVGGVGGGGVSGLLDWVVMVPGFVAAQQTGCLRFMNQLVETAKLPPEQWAAAFAQIRQEIPNLPVLARLLAPAMDKIAEACRRNHVVLRCTITALAMERFRKEKGQWPESLAELVATGYLKAVPTDPFDGRPIRLKRLADGWLIYATGQDGKDYGGTLNREKMYQAGSDMGMQLWDVAARRQPPPKPPEPDDEVPPAPAAPPPGGAPPAGGAPKQ